MHDEREPKRLFDDAAIGPEMRRDLQHAARPWSNPKKRDAALTRFVATIAATSTLGFAGSAKAIWWWVAGGAALIAVGGATVVVVRSRSEEVAVVPPAVIVAPPRPAAIDEPIAPAPAVDLAVPEPSTPTPEPRVRRRASREPEPVVAEPVVEPAPEPVTERIALLQRETTLMNEERREAQTGDARRALEIARDAEREFPRGVFAAEREAFAIVALDRLGEHEAVAARGARFLELHPRAPQSAMIRRIMEH